MKQRHVFSGRFVFIVMFGCLCAGINAFAITALPSNPAGAVDKWWCLLTGDKIPAKDPAHEIKTTVHTQQCAWGGEARTRAVLGNEQHCDGVILEFTPTGPLTTRMNVTDGVAGVRDYWINVSETTTCSCGAVKQFGPSKVSPP